ncbi:MAG: DMT family transporter [Bacteroidetes bacterium]|nr:DMT family transporter [Bacteroidota bacterium]
MPIFIFILIAFIWSIGFYLTKIANYAFGPITIGAIGSLGGACVLWLYWLIKKTDWKLTKNHILPLCVVTLIGFVWPFAITPFLIREIGHGFIGVVVSLVPILTILVSIPILKVYPSRMQLAGVLAGLLCMILLTLDGLNRNAPLLLLVVAMMTPLCYAISNSLVQRNFQNISTNTLVAVLMTGSGVVLMPLAMTFEEVTLDGNFVEALIALIVFSIFCRGLATVLFYKLIKEKGPLFAGLITYVIPVGVLFWSWFDDEKITANQIAAVIIVLIIVVFVQKDILKRKT